MILKFNHPDVILIMILLLLLIERFYGIFIFNLLFIFMWMVKFRGRFLLLSQQRL